MFVSSGTTKECKGLFHKNERLKEFDFQCKFRKRVAQRYLQ